GVRNVAPAIEGRAWASDREGTAGPVPVRYRSSSGPAPSAGEARITGAIAARLHSGPGDEIRLTSSRTRLSPIRPVPVSTVVTVGDVRGGSALDKPGEIEISEASARLLSDAPSGAGAYEARLANPLEADGAARAVARTLGDGYRVETWRELNGPLA